MGNGNIGGSRDNVGHSGVGNCGAWWGVAGYRMESVRGVKGSRVRGM